MAHAGEEFAFEAVRSLQFTILFFQPLVGRCKLGRKLLVYGVNSRLGLPPIGNIPDDRHNPRTISRANRAEADLDRKLEAILPPSEEFQADAHRAHRRVFGVSVSVLVMWA